MFFFAQEKMMIAAIKEQIGITKPITKRIKEVLYSFLTFLISLIVMMSKILITKVAIEIITNITRTKREKIPKLETWILFASIGEFRLLKLAPSKTTQTIKTINERILEAKSTIWAKDKLLKLLILDKFSIFIIISIYQKRLNYNNPLNTKFIRARFLLLYI